MTTDQTPRPVPMTTRASLRRAAATALVVPALALAGCSGDDPITATNTTSAATGASSTSTASTTSAAVPTEGATSTATPTATAPAEPARIDMGRNLVVGDPELGSQVKIMQFSRHLPWPAGASQAQKDAFEIMAVKVSVTAGKRYSATIALKEYGIRWQNRLYGPTTEFGQRYLPVVPTVKAGETKSGYLVFLMPKNTTGTLEFVLQRPAYTVPATGANFPARSWAAKIS